MNNTLRKVIHFMVKPIEDLLAEIDTIASDHDIEQDAQDKINTAINTALPAAVTAATAGMQKQIDDSNTALQAIVDKLTAEGAPTVIGHTDTVANIAQTALDANKATAATGNATDTASASGAATGQSQGDTAGAADQKQSSDETEKESA